MVNLGRVPGLGKAILASSSNLADIRVYSEPNSMYITFRDACPEVLDMLFGRIWREDPSQIAAWENEGGACV